MADRVIVMYAGRCVESGTAEDILLDPRHPYTQGLIACIPHLCRDGDRRHAPLREIPGMSRPSGTSAGCAFAPAARWAKPACSTGTPPVHDVRRARHGLLQGRPVRKELPMTVPTDGIPLLEVRNLHIRFPAMKRHFFDRQRFVHAADDVSFTLERGRTLGLVGESGSGKTTVARGVMRLVKPASGDVLLDGESVLPLRGDALSAFRRRVQFIFQDPYSSLNPRSRAGDIIREPMDLLDVGPKEGRGGEVLRLMEAVGLRPDQARLFPHQFSGGQRQRSPSPRARQPPGTPLLRRARLRPRRRGTGHRSSTSCAGCKTSSASATCSSPTISG